MRDAATARQAAPGGCMGPFYGPSTRAPRPCAAFNDYVRCRWPIRIFALDPATDEQYVEEHVLAAA